LFDHSSVLSFFILLVLLILPSFRLIFCFSYFFLLLKHQKWSVKMKHWKNVEQDFTGSINLAGERTQTISIQSTGSSSCCTVLLGVTLSNMKLPPCPIFKGMPKWSHCERIGHHSMPFNRRHGLILDRSRSE
jgi:hypothetical protein